LTGKSFNRLEIKDEMDRVAKKINCIFSPEGNYGEPRGELTKYQARSQVIEHSVAPGNCIQGVHGIEFSGENPWAFPQTIIRERGMDPIAILLGKSLGRARF